MKKLYSTLGIAVVATLMGVLLYNMTTLNYTILTGIFVVIALSVSKWKRYAEIVIALAVVLVCLTLKNYFQADGVLYSNSDHHAMRVDGYTFKQPNGYLLAADSENALLDNEYYNGQLTIQNFDSTGVTLKLDGFTQSLYADSYDGDELKSSTLLNEHSLIMVDPLDSIVFVGKNNVKYQLSLKYIIEDNFFKDDVAECCYTLKTPDGVDTLSEKRIIKKGLDLNTVMGGVSGHGISFSGINFVRPKTFTGAVSNNSCAKRELAIELDKRAFTPDATIKEIQVRRNNNTQLDRYVLSNLKSQAETIKLDIGQAFSVGCLGDLKSSYMRFKLKGDSLSLEYITPKYHYLSSLNDLGSNTIFVTTSLNSDVIANRAIPENIMKFDLFEREDNQNIFEPFYLSYTSGATTQGLEFEIDNKTKIQTGEYIRDLDSKSGKISWNVQIENFKETARHIQENNIIWFIIFIGIVCFFNISSYRYRYGEQRGIMGDESRQIVAYLGPIEIISYLALLLFFSFRLLLMWRGAVFPPVEQATIYELNDIFRNEEVIFIQFFALNTFFAVISYLKMAIRETNIIWKIARILVQILIYAVVEIILFDLLSSSWTRGEIATVIFVLPLASGVIISEMCIRFFGSTRVSRRIREMWHGPKKNNMPKESIDKISATHKIIKNRMFLIITLIVVGIIIPFSCSQINKLGTLGKILAPLCGYLLLEAVIWKFWRHKKEKSGKYCLTDDPESKENKKPKLKDIFDRGLGLSVVNGLIFSAIFIALDGGYGIIFLAFFLFSTILKLYDFYGSYINRYLNKKISKAQENSQIVKSKRIIKRKHKIVTDIVILGLLCVALFAFFDIILSWIYQSNVVLCGIVCSGVLALICVLLRRVLLLPPLGSIQWNLSKKVICVLSVIVVAIIGTLAFFEEYTLTLIVALLILAAVSFICSNNLMPQKRSRVPKTQLRKIFAWSLCAVGFIMVSSATTIVMKEYFFARHTAQRVVVRTMSPKEGLAKTQTAEDERRFFEASVNDYILNVYNVQGEEVSFVGEDGKGYFKPQQHSKVGALFGAQASDILTARFIVSEHGTWLYMMFMLLYLVLLFHAIKIKTRYRVSKMLLMQIPCLLFIHSLFVWMANTQLFIFLGQDVPLFSLHSKFSIMLYFVLMTIWVCVSISDRHMPAKNNIMPVANNVQYNIISATIFVSALIIMYVVLSVRYASLDDDDKYYMNKVYSLENFLDTTGTSFVQVNNLFEKFQKDSLEAHLVQYREGNNPNGKFKKNNDSTKLANAFMTKLAPNKSDISASISSFNGKHGNEIKTMLGGENDYKYRIWQRFAEKGGAKHNTSTALLHVRKMAGMYYLTLRKKFYDRELPSANDNQWRGSVIASADQSDNVRAISASNGVKQYILPKDWVNSSDGVAVLVNQSGQSITLGSGDAIHAAFEMTPNGYSSTCQRFAKDQNPIFGNGLASLASSTFFARNVVINGRRDFVYPMGPDFFWAYSFANEVKKQKNKTTKGIKSEALPEDFHADIPITIDQALTKNLRDKLEDLVNGNRTYTSVIVADGNGQIRAMVDYRRGDYSKLNPNDTKKIAKISEGLYMDYIYQIDNAYFGNINLMEIPGGPGSSQKPIVWTAVASGIDYSWKDLCLARIQSNNESPRKGDKYYIDRFNGQRLNDEFSAPHGDENGGEPVTLYGYMSHSSNFYNALMLYIGAFNSPNMDKDDGSPIFAKFSSRDYNNVEKYKNVFPIMYSGNANRGYLRLNQELPKDYQNSILLTRMNQMFGFDVNKSYKDFRSIYPSELADSAKSSYAFDRTSRFDFSILDGKDGSHDFAPFSMSQRIHQPAVGGQGIWRVTPLFMAQCFGRLVMMKSNYNLSVEPANKEAQEYVPFSDLSAGYKAAREEFLGGMNNLITLGTFNAIKKMLSDRGYFIYAKTGTSTEPATERPLLESYGMSNVTKNLHRLGLVITNQDMSKKDEKGIKDVKFYTIYFTTRATLGTGYKDVVESVINSATFKEYMRSNDE